MIAAYELASETFRTPHGRSVRMHYRLDTNDFNTLSSTLDSDEYKLPKGLAGTALDIGGYLGSVGIALALDNPELRVLVIEPVPPNAALIRRNIEENEVGDRVTLIEGAVGKGGEQVEVWYGYRGSESLEHHAFVGNSTLAYETTPLDHDSVSYRAIGLMDLIRDQPERDYARIAFMKIDTEGAEWAFLDSPGVLYVDTIVGEWHPVRGHTMGDLLTLLDASHVVTFDGPQAGPGGFRAVRR